MLITREQINTLQLQMDKRYAAKLIRNMRDAAPDLIRHDSEAALTERITAVLPLARQYGIHTDAATAKVAMLASVIGPQLFADEAMKQYLEAPGLTVDGKIEMLYELLAEQLSPQED